MASATITVTITDTPNHPLTTIRDKVCARLGYNGPNTNPAKIAFIQAFLANVIKNEYIQQLHNETQASASTELDIT